MNFMYKNHWSFFLLLPLQKRESRPESSGLTSAMPVWVDDKHRCFYISRICIMAVNIHIHNLLACNGTT